MVIQKLMQNKTMVAVGVLAALQFCTEVNAQTDTEQEIEVISVTGSRLQNVKAIDTRRDSKAIVDAVTSDDVGRLPDFNIGEALQRLPGIGIQNDQAEARFVTIRALNAEYNYTTVDGVSIAVPDRDGRRVFMDVMPASLAERIDVYKTFTPDLEGGAIGGVIDIRTASAFDKDYNTFTVNAELGNYENNKGFRDTGPSGNADIFYSNKFGENDLFGIVISANYYKRDSTVPQIEFGSSKSFFNSDGKDAGKPADGVYPGNGYAVPTERRAFFYHNDRTRYGGTFKFEVRPNDKSEYFIRTFWNTAKDDEARQTDLLRYSQNSSNVIVDQSATSGTILAANGLQQRHYLGQFDFTRSVWAITGGADYTISDGELQIRANYSGSKFDNDEDWIEWRLSGDKSGNGVDDNAFKYNLDNGLYYFELLDPSANTNFANFAPERRQFDIRGLDEELYEFKLDWLDTLNDSWSYKTGLGYRKIDRSFDEERDRYQPVDKANHSYTMAAAGVVNSDICLQAPGYYDNQCIVVIDPNLANSSWINEYATNTDNWTLNELSRDDNNKDYSLIEEVKSAYIMFNWVGDLTDVTFGLRYEDTTVEGVGRRDVDGQGWVDIESKGGYDYLLPSISMSHYLQDELLLRAAYSQSIGRPSFDKISPKGESFDPATLTLSRGNPDLKPRESNNFDLGLDWYFDDGEGILAANLFYKQIDGEIFTATQSGILNIDGIEEQIDITQPVNSDKTTDVKGLEVQFIKSLDNLVKGMGISMNATLLDTNFQYQASADKFYELETMIGQPDKSYNTAIYYDSDVYTLRLAYNYQSKRASHRLYSDNYRNRFDGSRNTVDFKASYRFSENLLFTFNAWNLTGEGRTESQGYSQEIPMVAADFGRAYFLGLSYNF